MESFEVGDIVDVRNYGRAEVIEPLVTEPGARFNGRIRVRYQRDGKTYYARPGNLRKTVQVKQRVLLCHSTTHYRTCAASVVNWGDAVLEVGSHEGECTWLLSRRCRYIVGVDKSPATVAAARRRYPGLRFEEVDGFDVPALKALGPPDGGGFSVVLVDIGGIASLSTVAALVGLYYKEFPYNTKIVVKSVFLKRMVENCLPYNTAKNNPWALLPVDGGAAASGDRTGAASSAAESLARPGSEPEQGDEEGEEGGEEADAGEGAAQAAMASVRGRRRGRRGRGGSGGQGSEGVVAERAGRRGRGRGGRGRGEERGAGEEEGAQPSAGVDGPVSGTGEGLGAEGSPGVGAGLN